MARTPIEEILNNTPSWFKLRDSISHCFQNRVPVQSNWVFSGRFGDLFEKNLPWVQKGWKQYPSIADALRGSQVGLLLSTPVIWSVAIPLVLLDLMATLYQILCFPIYGIPTVDRSKFVIIDRHKLAYLNVLEKFNCVYCGYGNGVLAYVREIASRTEERWCPIKHAKPLKKAHPRYADFAEYGDADGFCQKAMENKQKEGRLS